MKNLKKSILLTVLALGAMLCLYGCSEDTPLDLDGAAGDPFTADSDKGVDIEFQDGSIIPVDLVDINCFGRIITCWPFTGAKLDGVPMDPVNLVFTGHADPVQIRAALLGLSGDRSALGLPDAYPFNQVWKDALGGGVQANYEAEGGWRGSVIQLTLGEYEPVRFHLRLFRTGATSDDGSPITLGAAHFEVLIPGTSDHQVLSWNAAKEIVVGDLMRSGLLNPATDLMPTDQITPAPGFRYIIPAVYNNLPPELLAIVGGPTPPVSDPVAIPNDGVAMVVRLAGSAPVVPDETNSMATINFGQFVPRPFCSSGPYDFLWIEGPVTFHNNTTVNEYGEYSYTGGYAGELMAVPIDPTTGQPIGEPFSARVTGSQKGFLEATNARVMAKDVKLTSRVDGPQRENIQFHVAEQGADRYKGFYKCLDEN